MISVRLVSSTLWPHSWGDSEGLPSSPGGLGTTYLLRERLSKAPFPGPLSPPLRCLPGPPSNTPLALRSVAGFAPNRETKIKSRSSRSAPNRSSISYTSSLTPPLQSRHISLVLQKRKETTNAETRHPELPPCRLSCLLPPSSPIRPRTGCRRGETRPQKTQWVFL